MNKLILLNKVREEKARWKNKSSNCIADDKGQKDCKNSYITFKEKFNCLQNKEELDNGNKVKIKRSRFERNLNIILERIFLLNNNTLLLEFINAIYNDDLSSDTKIKYTKDKKSILKDPNYNIKILAEDEYKKFEYVIQFQIKDEQNIGIIISKKQLLNNPNVISFNRKRQEYINENNLKNNCKKCLIILNSNVEVPDACEFIADCDGKDIACKVNIIKSWKYDFKQLLENKMYLLIPTKVIDFMKIISRMNNDILSKEEMKETIKKDIIGFYKDMNRYLNKIKADNLITENDIDEINILAVDLLNEFIRDKNNILIDIKRDIEDALKGIVV